MKGKAAKIIDRKTYLKNKHIYPCYLWEKLELNQL